MNSETLSVLAAMRRGQRRLSALRALCFGFLGVKLWNESKNDPQETTDQAGDGPSDVEMTHSPDGQEQARREYREVFPHYEQMSQAVPDSEPIPLGHRQTIRNDFELIRPGVDELAETDERATE